MNILIGISGGIAAYKIADLVRMFVKEGNDVKTVLTENAHQFITTGTLETLSNNKCYTNLFNNTRDINHIELVKWADLMIIAPATANILGKIANGICDDLLSTIVIAIDKPCFIFPSMNSAMFSHPSVQNNIIKLREWGYIVYEPSVGELACKDIGKGRLPDIKQIYEIVLGEIERSQIESSLLGKSVVITAGSTRAYIDPVRYISNSSSGRMGIELVKQMWLRGAEVTLICNQEVIERFPEIVYYTNAVIYVTTTEDVLKTVTGVFDDADIYISAAALCDFKNNPQPKKIKKTSDGTMLGLQAAVDVFSEVAELKKNQLMVGFALETDDLENNAKTKLGSKKMDMIVANTIDAIGSESSSVILIDAKGIRKYVKETEKKLVAAEIAEEIENLLYEKGLVDENI